MWEEWRDPSDQWRVSGIISIEQRATSGWQCEHCKALFIEELETVVIDVETFYSADPPGVPMRRTRRFCSPDHRDAYFANQESWKRNPESMGR